MSSLRPLSFALAAACAAVPAAAQQPKHAPAARTRHAVAAPASAMPDLAPAAAAVSTLDPSLRALADLGTGKTSQAVRVAQQRRVLLDAQGRVSALAELAPGASAASLEALGAEVTGVYGDVVAVRMPVERLAELGASRAVRRVQASRQTYRPRTLNSRAEIRADLVHAGQNLPRAVTGTGAVAGVVDSGVDLAHPDFWTAAGGSRFLAVRDDWPATDRVYTRAQIEGGSRAAATTALADTFAHGTHVAGTLGGSGQANAAMKGIAPGADLVFVKTTFEDASILSGCNFVFTQARAQNKPAVCNLSLGGHAGPHDGTSAFDRAIANLVQPGYLVVAAAGNEGGMESVYGAPGAIHVGQQMTAGREARMMYWPQYLSDLDEAILQGWYDPRAVTQIQVNVYAYDDNGNASLAMQTPVFQAGQAPTYDLLLTKGGTSYGYLSIDAQTTADAANGDGLFEIYLYDDLDGEGYISSYGYEVVVKGTAAGRMDAWDAYGTAYFVDLDQASTTFDVLRPSQDRTIAEPASSPKAISVGAYANTLSWTSFDGNAYTWPGYYATAPQAGQLSDFSSRGPTRDGRRAPVVSAPGELVFGPFAPLAWRYGLADTATVDRSGKYIGMAGTSMAAPHVAGVVALMLDVNPRLTYEQVVSIFQSSARRDGFTGTTPNDRTGFGKIDALAAVQAAAALASDVEEDAHATGLALDAPTPNPARGRTLVRYAADRAVPVRLAVYDVLGREVAVLADGMAAPGAQEAALDASGLAPGTYLLRLSAGAQVRTQRLVVAR